MSTHTTENFITDEYIDGIRAKLAGGDANDIKAWEACINQNKILITSLIDRASKKADLSDADSMLMVDRLKRIIRLAPSDEILMRIMGKVWSARDHILKRNAKFFLDRDYDAMIKKDRNQAMIETIVSLVKAQYYRLNVDELEEYWQFALGLLKNVCVAMKLLEKLTV